MIETRTIAIALGTHFFLACSHKQPQSFEFAALEGLDDSAITEPALLSKDERYVKSFFSRSPDVMQIPGLKFPASLFFAKGLENCTATQMQIEQLANIYNTAYSRIPDVLKQTRIGLDRTHFVNSNVLFLVDIGTGARALFIDERRTGKSAKLEPIIKIGCDSLIVNNSSAIIREFGRLYLYGKLNTKHARENATLAAEKVRMRYLDNNMVSSSK